MKRFILGICCVIAVSAPVLGEVSKESLASLIQAGHHKEALAWIRAGADVNEAQPDGTRPYTGPSTMSITSCWACSSRKKRK